MRANPDRQRHLQLRGFSITAIGIEVPTSRVFRELLARRWSFNRLQLAQSLTKPRKITQTELASRLSSCGEGHGEMR
jgi:hypothetical protein